MRKIIKIIEFDRTNTKSNFTKQLEEIEKLEEAGWVVEKIETVSKGFPLDQADQVEHYYHMKESYKKDNLHAIWIVLSEIKEVLEEANREYE